MDQPAAKTQSPDEKKGKRRRKDRTSRGNGRETAASPSPRLRDVLFKDLRPSDLPRNFRLDLKRLYRFYLDEERRAQLAAMGRIRRTFKLIGWLLKSLLAKLSPGRRLALFASLVMCFLGQVHLNLPDGDKLETDLRFWGFLILLLVLMLELMEKVAARDEIEIARQVQLALLPRTHPHPGGTMCHCEIGTATGRLRFLNAGHNPPFVLRASAIETLEASAIPLGMMAGTIYKEGDMLLQPGDALVVYSDGLTEARNAADEEFGAERLRALLPRLRGLAAEQAVRLLIDQVTAFLGGERPHDDLSLVVLARPGAAAGLVPPPFVNPAARPA